MPFYIAAEFGIDVENAKFSIPPWKALMRFRVVVTSCLDAGILVGAHCTNTQLMAMEDEVATSIHPHRKPKHVVQPHWTHLLIDEVCFESMFYTYTCTCIRY